MVAKGPNGSAKATIRLEGRLCGHPRQRKWVYVVNALKPFTVLECRVLDHASDSVLRKGCEAVLASIAFEGA